MILQRAAESSVAKLVPHFLDLHFFRGEASVHSLSYTSFRPQHPFCTSNPAQPTVSRSPSSLHYLPFSSSLVIHDVLIRKVLVTYRCLFSHVRVYSGLFSLAKPYCNLPESILIRQNLVQFPLFQKAGRSLLHYSRQRTNIEHVPSQTFLSSELIN